MPTFTPDLASLGLGAAFALVPALLLVRPALRRAAAAPAALSPPAAARPAFVLFGDSITQQSFAPGGWGAAVTDHYQRTADVVLRGYSGYNTRWALRLLPRIFPCGAAHPTPALVTVLLGANDANRPAPLHLQDEFASRQHVPLEEYVANLRKILEAATTAGAGGARLLLITPPPLDEAAWQACCVAKYAVPPDAAPNRDFATTKRYAQAVVALGKEAGVPTLDLHGAFVSRADWRELLSDGLHPNEAGGRFIGSQVLAAIGKHYPELTPAAHGQEEGAQTLLPMDFPDHKGIDTTRVDGSFASFDKQRQRALRSLSMLRQMSSSPLQ